MGFSKEMFMEQREWAVTMSDQVYRQLPEQVRGSFTSERAYYPEQHKTLYENDPVYRELYKTYRKAKKELENYKYNKRNA